MDVLSARAARTISIHLDFFGTDFDVAVFLNVGHYVYRRKRSLSARVRIERRNSDQPVNAMIITITMKKNIIIRWIVRRGTDNATAVRK